MSLGAQVSLITATLDLQLVKLLRQAIRTADLSSARERFGVAGQTSPVIEPRPHLHPEPRIEPRPVLHPTPRIEPRTLHPTRIEAPPPLPPSCECEKPHITPSPFQPPWKVLPWKNTPPPPVQRLKIVMRPPDIPKKGSVFDVFI